MKKNNSVTIVIPTRNRSEKLKRLLASIRSSAYTDYEVIIVNNGDPLSLKLHKNETVIQNKTNEGLAAARNKGAESANGEYLLFVDDDNVFEKRMIEKLVYVMKKRNDIIAVSPRMYYLESPAKVWFMGARMNLWTTKPYFYKAADFPVNSDVCGAEILHNCFLMRKNQGEKVGWFDTKLFMNGTEYDLFQRLRRKMNDGKTAAVVMNATCWHDIPLMSNNLIRSLGFENPKRAYYFQRNRGVFLYRYGSIMQRVVGCVISLPFFTILYGILFLSVRRFDLLRQHIRGSIDAYQYMFRPL